MSEPQPEPSPAPLSRDSFKIVESFLDKYAESPDVFVIGGLGSAALAHPDMRISDKDRVISVPNLELTSIRPDGTTRDIDILVTSTDPKRTLEIEWDIARAARDDLGVSVCNIANGEEIIHDLGRPFDLRTIPSGFTSNRYTDPFSGDDQAIVRYLFPFVAPLDKGHFTPWTVEVEKQGLVIPVPPPASTLSNYLVRSVIGLRPADKDKIERAATNVFEQSPEQREWLVDGPGANQLELAAVLRSLHRRGARGGDLLPGINKAFYSHHELTHHDMFAAEQLNYIERRAVLAGAMAKSAATLVFESHPGLKAWFRGTLEERAVQLVDRRHDH